MITLNISFYNVLYRLRFKGQQDCEDEVQNIYYECFCCSVAPHLDSAGAFEEEPCHANPDQVVPQAPPATASERAVHLEEYSSSVIFVTLLSLRCCGAVCRPVCLNHMDD